MIPASVRIFVCTEPQDMRRSFDGLALAARQVVGEDPKSGALFVFRNKRANRLKILWWDKNGFCILYKRLHGANFVTPDPPHPSCRSLPIDAKALAKIIEGVVSGRRKKFRKAA